MTLAGLRLYLSDNDAHRAQDVYDSGRLEVFAPAEVNQLKG
jgi:hypothetical protein